MNSDTVESAINNVTNIEIDKTRYFLWEYTLCSTCLCNLLWNMLDNYLMIFL